MFPFCSYTVGRTLLDIVKINKAPAKFLAGHGFIAAFFVRDKQPAAYAISHRPVFEF